MNNILKLKHVLLGAVAGVLITLSLAAATGTARATWEYKVVGSISINNDQLTKMLNEFGDEQWELVSATYTPKDASSGDHYARFVFKRQR